MQASPTKSPYLVNLERNRAEYAKAVEKRRAKMAQVHLQGTDVPVETDGVCK